MRTDTQNGISNYKSRVEALGCSRVRGYPEVTGMGNMGGCVEGVSYLLDGTRTNGIFGSIMVHTSINLTRVDPTETMTHGSVYLST